jgi:hypothetical protein
MLEVQSLENMLKKLLIFIVKISQITFYYYWSGFQNIKYFFDTWMPNLEMYWSNMNDKYTPIELPCFPLMLKRSWRSLTSIIHSSAQWGFNANNERLLATAKCSTALSKFGVVSSRIPKYLKVYTRSITSPLKKTLSMGQHNWTPWLLFFSCSL